MHKPPFLTSNFACLQEHDAQLLRLGMLAERYFPDDPNTTLLKLRQLAELLAQLEATQVGLYQSSEESQYDLLCRLQDQGILPREIAQLFDEVRRAGNAASHAIAGDHRTALATLKITWQLGLWFHRTFRNPSFKSGPFIPPQAPQDESAGLRAELTHKQLRELALELDKASFSEASLATAWREMTNQDIAARIVGYIRQAAIGDPLVPYDQRVDSSLQKLLASRQWSTPQRQWLQRIAAQTKANMLVDCEALDDPDLVFRREGGGFARLDRIFGGKLQKVLDTFNESLWATA